MTLLSIEHIVGTNGYYIDDDTLQIYSFKQDYKNGKLMKGHYTKKGYIRYCFFVNDKRKFIYYHVIIVKMFIKPNYDYKNEEIDHKNHDKNDNRIENLAVVTHLENQRNIPKSWNGKKFNFVDNIGNSLVINEEAKIYYSLDLDKFFMQIKQSDKFKELHECLINGYPYIQYYYNNKNHAFNTEKFKKNLKKQ